MNDFMGGFEPSADPADWVKVEEPQWSFPLLTPDDCEAQPPKPYVVKGLIGQGDLVVIFGHPSAGKSLLAPYIAYAVARGDRVFGRRVRQGRVLYIAAEDGEGMMARVKAMRRRTGPAPDFRLLPKAIDLRAPDSPALAELDTYVRWFRPSVIVIDTVFRAFPGLLENEAGDMGHVVKVCRDLAAICGSAVIVLAHPAKDGGTTPGGHRLLNVDADITLQVEGSGNGLRTVRLGKNRSGPSDTTFTFGKEVEDLGKDEDGDEITAPIAAEVEQTEADRLRPKKAKLSDRPALLLRELENALAEQGEPAEPKPDMPLVTAVPRRLLRERLIRGGFFPESALRNGSADSCGVNSEGYSAAAPQAAGLLNDGYRMENHALTTLKRNGFVGCTRDWIWLS